MKPALDDVDVVIPVRIDTEDRLENLDTVLAFFDEAFTGHRVLVIEHAAEIAARDCALAHGADYHFVESGGCFHKSRVFNLGIALADRPFVLLYDCDVLLHPESVVAARDALAADRLDFVYPYNGILLQIARARVRGAAGALSLLLASLPRAVADRDAALPADVEFLHGSRAEPSSGAALMAVRRRLVLAGGLNENIVSYGCEDTELATRLAKLGTRVNRLDGFSAYHIAHRRGPDSHYNNFHATNLAEWRKVEAMDRTELEAYVQNGFRHLELDSDATLVVENTTDAFAMRLARDRGSVLDDVTFLVPVRRASATVVRLLEAFLDRLDAAYDNYDLFLVEIGGYDFQSSSHRDHVLYVHAADRGDWLMTAARQTTKPLVCVCSPLTDVAPERLLPAVDRVRSDPSRSARIDNASLAGIPDAHAGKLVAAVSSTLPVRGAALVCSRERLFAAGGGRPDAAAEAVDLDALAAELAIAAERSGRAGSR